MIEDFYKDGIIIERKTTAPNTFGGESETWATHLTISGLIDFISGQKSPIAGQFADKTSHILICDSGLDITTQDRVNDNNIIYRILNIDNPFDNHCEVLLECLGVDQP